jgi:hypothetical protein
MTMRLIHLSDIHFGQERNGEVFVHDDVRDRLKADVALLAKRQGPPDLILVTGDMAFSGNSKEFEVAAAWLDDLANCAGCRPKKVRTVPGNHDCDRSANRTVADVLHGAIRGASPREALNMLDSVLTEDPQSNALLPKFAGYRKFTATYGCDGGQNGVPVWFEDLPLGRDVTLRLFGLNSVRISDGYDARGNMLLGRDQHVIPVKENVINAVMMHHPLDWCIDREDAQRYFRNRVAMLMTGHQHRADLRKLADANGNEWLEIDSGATNPPDTGGLYQFTYNWLEISLGTDQRLRVNVYPRVWLPTRTSFAADTQRLAGTESAEFVLDCFGPLRGAQSVSQSATFDTPRGLPEWSNDMRIEDDEAFSTLRYLFWRYLGWWERLNVLVQIDVLPRTASQPVPQTLERLAMETARKQGKLGKLWDAVMSYVPEDKRQSNPFTSKD